MSRLLRLLLWAVIPAAFIGPGTVTVAASAGATHGFSLLWALLFSTLATLVLQEAAARLAAVSGRDLGEAIREQWGAGASGVLVLALVLGAIVVGNAAYEAGNLLGAAAGAALELPLPPAALTLIIGAVATSVLWVGTPRRVAQLLAAAVAFMGIAFLAAAVLLRPPLEAVFAGAFIPRLLPDSTLLVLGLVGTTVVPYNLFLGSGIAAGQTLRELRLGIGVAVILGGIISMAILIVGTSVVGPFSYEALAATLGRLGPGAPALFAWGLFAAGVSSAITAPLAAAVTARSLFGASDERWGTRGVRYRSVWLGVLLVGVGFGVSGVRPVPAIVIAQALNGIVLPFAAVFLLLAVNDRRLLGDGGINGYVANALTSAVVAVTVILGVSALLRAGVSAFGGDAPTESVVCIAATITTLTLALPVSREMRHRRTAVHVSQ
ncbi:Nramp family divalent metal transporter [soil metagenome]